MRRGRKGKGERKGGSEGPALPIKIVSATLIGGRRHHHQYSYHQPTDTWPDPPKLSKPVSTNRARRSLTLLMWPTLLPLRQTSRANRHKSTIARFSEKTLALFVCDHSDQRFVLSHGEARTNRIIQGRVVSSADVGYSYRDNCRLCSPVCLRCMVAIIRGVTVMSCCRTTVTAATLEVYYVAAVQRFSYVC